MKLRHIDQCIGVIPPTVLSPDGSIFELYDRFNYLRGYLWSGRRAKFEQSVDRLIGRRLGKGQHMCWTKRGAHLLLQVRCAVLNSEFLQRYQRWFPAVGTRSIGLPWDWRPTVFNGSKRHGRCWRSWNTSSRKADPSADTGSTLTQSAIAI